MTLCYRRRVVDSQEDRAAAHSSLISLMVWGWEEVLLLVLHVLQQQNIVMSISIPCLCPARSHAPTCFAAPRSPRSLAVTVRIKVET